MAIYKGVRERERETELIGHKHQQNHMAMRSALCRFKVTRSMESTRGATRYFSDGTGRILSEEERAAENVYIQVNFSLIIRYVDFLPSSSCKIVEEEKL